MRCHNCDKTFDYSDELKFCPFCGCEVNKRIQINLGNTLGMPPITDRDIRRRKNRLRAERALGKTKSLIMNPKIGATVITLCAIIILSVWAYRYYAYGAVDAENIKQDLENRQIHLSKGHWFTIKESCIKDMKIISSKKEKGKKEKDVTVDLQLNNDELQVKGRLDLYYIYKGSSKWVPSKNMKFKTDYIRPAAGIKEAELMEQLKGKSVKIEDSDVYMENPYLRQLHVVNEKLYPESKKENLKVKVMLDSGIESAEGQLDVALAFKNYKWKVVSVDQTSEFSTGLSTSFSESSILKDMRTVSVEGNYIYNDIFNGQSFYISDDFVKSVKLKDKSYDDENKQLKVQGYRVVQAGNLKVTFSEGYTYSVSFNGVERITDEKPIISSVKVDNISDEEFQKLIVGTEILGKKKFFLWNDIHSITEEEAKTFKLEKVDSDSSNINEQYVSGKITLNVDDENKEENVEGKISLQYNPNEGYIWHLDKMVTSESPEYDDLD